MPPPAEPKIYHILHLDRLRSVLDDGHLWCDARMAAREGAGTTIGMSEIKARRLTKLFLDSHRTLRVGECVPFYFCPRSVMLYLIWHGNHPNLGYRGGQQPIVHLQADMHATVDWAVREQLRWAFTLSNAGSRYFEDRADLEKLHEVNWDAVQATKWAGPGVPPSVEHGKQAEFLVEDRFPWQLVEGVGVLTQDMAQQVATVMLESGHRPPIEVRPDWYY